MNEITDIWFKTSLSLVDLANKLGIEKVEYDSENYWEWITGYWDTYNIDITRTHCVKPMATDTNIFLLKEKIFEKDFIVIVTTKLNNIGISPIYLGQRKYIGGEDFENIIIMTVAKHEK